MLTREDTHRKIEQEAKSDSSMHENYIHVLVAKMIVNEIFNEHEVQMKAKDERIRDLEEAMKPKTCLDCKHYSQSTFYGDLKVVKYCHENRLGIGDINFQIFCCNKFEPKDNA